MNCECDQDPEYHRDLNKRRGKEDQGAKCTNTVDPESYGQQGGICMACVFGCFE